MGDATPQRIDFVWRMEEDSLERDLIAAIRSAPSANRIAIIEATTLIHACTPLYRRMRSGQISEDEARLLAVKYSNHLKAIAAQYDQLFGLMPGMMPSTLPSMMKQSKVKTVVQPSASPALPAAFPMGTLYADELNDDWMEE